MLHDSRSSPSNASRSHGANVMYRPDIDGLQALAVVSAALLRTTVIYRSGITAPKLPTVVEILHEKPILLGKLLAPTSRQRGFPTAPFDSLALLRAEAAAVGVQWPNGDGF
jgi:hypothetical protein